MPQPSHLFQIFFSLIGAVGICGNGLVCLTIAKVRFMHTLTNAFIFNQALIDLLGSVAILTSRLVIPVPDPFPTGTGGLLLCILWVTNVFVFQIFFTSTFNLVALTLERYLAIVYPFRYQNLGTPRNAKLVLIVVWMSAFLLNSFGFFIQRYQDGKCEAKTLAHQEILGVVVLIMTYLIPVTMMLIVHVRITVILKREAMRVKTGPAPSHPQGESLMRARRNTFKTLVIVCTVFVVCWTPNEIIFFLFNLGVDVDLSSSLYVGSVGLASANCCINPFIYAIKYKQFRKALKTLVCKKKSAEFPLAVVNVGHGFSRNLANSH